MFLATLSCLAVVCCSGRLVSGELIRVVAGEDREGCRRGILLMRFSVIAEIGVGVQSEVTLPGLQLLAPR